MHANGNSNLEQALCDLLGVYCKEQHLPEVSADELAAKPGTTRAQYDWLIQFVHLWDASMRAMDTPTPEPDTEEHSVEPELVRRDDGTFAFKAGGVEIDYPFESSCGRFACTPENYGFVRDNLGGGEWAWVHEFNTNGLHVVMLISNVAGHACELDPRDSGRCLIRVYEFGNPNRCVQWVQTPDTDNGTGCRLPAESIEVEGDPL